MKEASSEGESQGQKFEMVPMSTFDPISINTETSCYIEADECVYYSFTSTSNQDAYYWLNTDSEESYIQVSISSTNRFEYESPDLACSDGTGEMATPFKVKAKQTVYIKVCGDDATVSLTVNAFSAADYNIAAVNEDEEYIWWLSRRAPAYVKDGRGYASNISMVNNGCCLVPNTDFVVEYYQDQAAFNKNTKMTVLPTSPGTYYEAVRGNGLFSGRYGHEVEFFDYYDISETEMWERGDSGESYPTAAIVGDSFYPPSIDIYMAGMSDDPQYLKQGQDYGITTYYNYVEEWWDLDTSDLEGHKRSSNPDQAGMYIAKIAGKGKFKGSFLCQIEVEEVNIIPLSLGTSQQVTDSDFDDNNKCIFSFKPSKAGWYKFEVVADDPIYIDFSPHEAPAYGGKDFEYYDRYDNGDSTIEVFVKADTADAFYLYAYNNESIDSFTITPSSFEPIKDVTKLSVGKASAVATLAQGQTKVYSFTAPMTGEYEFSSSSQTSSSDPDARLYPSIVLAGYVDYDGDSDANDGNDFLYTAYLESGDIVYLEVKACEDSKFTVKVVNKSETSHNWGSGTVTKQPDCTNVGTRSYTCAYCGATKTENIAKKGHSWKTAWSWNASHGATVALTCANNGSHRANVSASVSSRDTGSSILYTATAKYDGKTFTNTLNAPKVSSMAVVLSPSSFTFDGAAKNPAVTVRHGASVLRAGSDYSVAYDPSSSAVGMHTVTINGIGKYAGTATASYSVNPKGTSLSKVKSSKKKTLTVKWKKQAAQTSGYDVAYSTSSKKGPDGQLTGSKVTTVSKSKTTSTTIKKLKSKKKYNVQIRTFLQVGGQKFCSDWSPTKSAKVK